MIEALGTISATELFVSGWSSARITDGTPVTVCDDGQWIAGELTVVRSDRPDAGPRSGFCGVLRTTVSLDAAFLAGGLRFANGEVLECYDRLVSHGQEQCIEILRAALAGRPVGETRALSGVAHRFFGYETLSGSALPIRLAVDDCLRLHPRLVFLRGWLADPERLCTRIDLVAGGANRIDEVWLAHARPDVGAMLAVDQRFAGYDRQDELLGFTALVEIDGWSDQPHLALTMAEGPPLYLPLNPRAGAAGALVRRAVRTTDPSAFATDKVIERLALLVAAVSDDPPVLLGADGAVTARVTLVMSCLGDVDELMMTLTSVASDAHLQDYAIIVAGPHNLIDASADRLHQHAALLGLRVGLARGEDVDDDVDALFVGASAARSDLVCLLPAGPVPRQAGWIGAMLGELERRPGTAVVASACLRAPAKARAIIETPAACLVGRGDVLGAIPECVILSTPGKWDAMMVALRAAGIAISEVSEPLFVAAPPAISPAEVIMRRIDAAARRLRQW